ncbi:MAG: phosphoribosylformylglycinamidine synthase subunit PurQ [archaeon]|nr:MAG: phosphoribosylformylglycinamidine synthase subunit PurQ [archaeon]
MKVKAMVLEGYGINCERETEYSFRLAGAEPERVHVNEFIWGEKKLEDYQIFVIPGGFSYGDDHGAGTVLASKLKNKKGEELIRFIEGGGLGLGICNGFQVFNRMGILPGSDENYDLEEVALMPNDSGNFIDNTVNLVNKESPCVFTKGIDRVDFPVRHAQGKIYGEDSVIKRLYKKKQVVMQYAKGSLTKNDKRYGYNPNGSMGDIAGICDSTGRVFGFMPHPEALNSKLNHPHWTIEKEVYKRRGEKMPLEGEGIQIFRNAVKYVQNNF